jgi:hypothetical protein
MAVMGIGVLSADEASTVTLPFSVTNPSPDRARDTYVKVSLPDGLRPTDILFSGELRVVFDNGTGLSFAQGMVPLGPGETRYFKVIVRNIWMISGTKLETAAASIRENAPANFREGMLAKLAAIRLRQAAHAGDAAAHIRVYRQNLAEYEQVLTELDNFRTREGARFWGFAGTIGAVGAVAGVLFLGVLWIARIRKKTGMPKPEMPRPLMEPNHFPELPLSGKIEYAFRSDESLSSEQSASRGSDRGIRASLDRRFPENAALNLKVIYPEAGDPLKFHGIVLSQAPYFENGKVLFKTTLSLPDVSEDVCKQIISQKS